MFLMLGVGRDYIGLGMVCSNAAIGHVGQREESEIGAVWGMADWLVCGVHSSTLLGTLLGTLLELPLNGEGTHIGDFRCAGVAWGVQ